eukprot:365157-Chlamydomonas_euryale.AAC.4
MAPSITPRWWFRWCWHRVGAVHTNRRVLVLQRISSGGQAMWSLANAASQMHQRRPIRLGLGPRIGWIRNRTLQRIFYSGSASIPLASGQSALLFYWKEVRCRNPNPSFARPSTQCVARCRWPMPM